MSFIKPNLSAADFETSTGSSENYGKIVPEGIYEMTVKGTPEIRLSQANNLYLNIQLNHTGDYKGSKPAFAMVMVDGKKASGEPIPTKKLGLFLAALGVTADDAADVEIRGLEGEETKAAAEILVRGDRVTTDGKAVRAKLEVEEYNGTERNKVAFIAPTE